MTNYMDDGEDDIDELLEERMKYWEGKVQVNPFGVEVTPSDYLRDQEGVIRMSIVKKGLLVYCTIPCLLFR